MSSEILPQPTYTRNGKPLPIVIYNNPCKNTIEVLSNTEKNFYIKKINNIKHLLFLNNIDNYKKACEVLKSNKVEFFTYTPKQDKKISILLKNLEGGFDPETVLDELQNIKIENIKFLSVKKFQTNRSLKEGRDLPIYLVQLSADSKTENLKQIQILLHSLVS